MSLTEAVGGYAYAFQAIGYYAWRFSEYTLTIDSSTVKKTLAATKEDLYRNAYERMYQDLSATDRKFLHVMVEAKQKEIPISLIAKELGKSKNYISVYRARLLEDQLIRSEQ